MSSVLDDIVEANAPKTGIVDTAIRKDAYLDDLQQSIRKQASREFGKNAWKTRLSVPVTLGTLVNLETLERDNPVTPTLNGALALQPGSYIADGILSNALRSKVNSILDTTKLGSEHFTFPEIPGASFSTSGKATTQAFYDAHGHAIYLKKRGEKKAAEDLLKVAVKYKPYITAMKVAGRSLPITAGAATAYDVYSLGSEVAPIIWNKLKDLDNLKQFIPSDPNLKEYGN